MSSESSDQADADRLSRTVCFLCRQRKTKCDRRLPRCGFCIKAKVDCQYVERAQKRGLRAGYVAELESRLEVLEREVQSLKHVQNSSIASASPAIAAQSTPVHSSTPQIPVHRDSGFSDAAAAITDLMTLPTTYMSTLADLWFKEMQPWVPILNREQIQVSLDALPTPIDHIDNIVLRAVIALQIAYSSQAICLGYKGRRRLSLYLRSQVLVEAIAKPSFDSLKALLLIAFLDYGSDDLPSTFSLLAVCRRMAENIGIFRQLLERIEQESPAHVGPPSRDTFGGNEAAIPLTWSILALDAVSTVGIAWRDVSAALVDHLSSVAYISVPDFSDSFRTHTHLAAIGLQPVHEFMAHGQHPPLASSDPLELCEEMYQNLMSYMQGLPETSYTLLADGAVHFDPCSIFTRMLSQGSIIIIYQRFIFSEDNKAMDISRRRCHDSCAAIVNTIRSMSDVDAEISSPLIANFIFVAARYQLALSRGLSEPRDTSFDILMHGLNMCGRRWPLARRLDIVLRAAIVELDTGASSPLPPEFWELKKSHLDISETLKSWVEDYKPLLYVGCLNGPYV